MEHGVVENCGERDSATCWNLWFLVAKNKSRAQSSHTSLMPSGTSGSVKIIVVYSVGSRPAHHMVGSRSVSLRPETQIDLEKNSWNCFRKELWCNLDLKLTLNCHHQLKATIQLIILSYTDLLIRFSFASHPGDERGQSQDRPFKCDPCHKYNGKSQRQR